ncbi:hypothetical protein D3C81_350330 [compost metagenome]
MNSLHPRVKQLLESQVGPGAQIVEATPGTSDYGHITVECEGVRTTVGVPKGDFATRFNGHIPAVVAVEGESMQEVLLRFSEKYALFLVPGVDVVLPEGNISFFGQLDKSTTTFTVTAPPTSVIWKGSILVQVFNKDSVIKPEGIARSNLEDSRVVLALSSKIFDGKGEVLSVNKDALTLAFSKKVIAYLKTCGITSLSPNDLGQGELMDVVADGFSGIAVVKPKTGPVLFIRYRSKGEDVNIPTPGDEDTE